MSTHSNTIIRQSTAQTSIVHTTTAQPRNGGSPHLPAPPPCQQTHREYHSTRPFRRVERRSAVCEPGSIGKQPSELHKSGTNHNCQIITAKRGNRIALCTLCAFTKQFCLFKIVLFVQNSSVCSKQRVRHPPTTASTVQPHYSECCTPWLGLSECKNELFYVMR
jgi:hypothetical protein